MNDIYEKMLDPSKDAKSEVEHAKEVVRRLLDIDPKEIALHDHREHWRIARRWNELRMHYVHYFRLPWWKRWVSWWAFKQGVEYHTRDFELPEWPTPEEAERHWNRGCK